MATELHNGIIQGESRSSSSSSIIMADKGEERSPFTVPSELNMDDSKSDYYYSETDHLGAGRVCVDSLASTFRIMERRRLLRVVGWDKGGGGSTLTRARSVSQGVLQAVLIFCLFIVLCQQLGLNITSSGVTNRWAVPLWAPVVVTSLVAVAAMVSVAQSQQFVIPTLMLTTLYLGMMWLAWVYDPDSDRTFFFLLKPTRSERLVLILIMSIELALFLAYALLHWLYPLLIHNISEAWLAKHWFRLQHEGDGWFRYIPYGIFTPRTWRRCRYTGSTDKEGRPHGTGEWRDDSFHGECLMGRFCHGEPVGPFRAREFGSGSLSVQTFIMYATSRAEMDLRETHFCPQRSEEGMRYGVVGVECCAGGDFYAHLPQVTDRVGQETREIGESLRTLRRNLRSAEIDTYSVSSPSRGGGNPLTSRLEDEDRRITAHLWPNRGLEVKGGYECSARVKIVGRSMYVLEPLPVTKPSSEALVFLHGYNCPTEYALLRLGQMLALGRFPSHIHPFVFSQATGQTLSYGKAKGCIGQFTTDLLDFLLDLRRKGYEHVHCLVHSMAAHLFFMILEEYEDRRFTDPEGMGVLRLSNVVLVNADFPVAGFEEVHVPRVLDVADRMTLYCDDRDFALLCSEVFSRDKLLMWPCFLREVAADVRGFASQLHRDVYGDRDSTCSATPTTDMSEGEEEDLTDTEEAIREDCFWEGIPFGALTSVDVLTCPSRAKPRYGRRWRPVRECDDDGDPVRSLPAAGPRPSSSASYSASTEDAMIQTEAGYVEELQETVAALEVVSFMVQKTPEAPSSKAPSKQALRSTYREIRDVIDQTIDLIPAHQYLQTITFGDSPLTVQEAGFHSRQLDPRNAKTTTRVLEEVLSKRKAEQEKISGAKKNAKKKKAKVTRPVSGAELREKLHAKIEALREARESQKEWKKAAKENEEGEDAAEAKRLRRAKQKADAAERKKKAKNGGKKKAEMKAAIAAKRKEREEEELEEKANVKEDLDFSSFNFKKRAADVEEHKEKKVSKRQRLEKEIEQAEKEQQQITQASTAEERVKLSQDKAIERAMKRAAGEKVHDDVHKLRKAQKAIDKKKNKSREEWAARSREVKEKQAAAQAKRKENIQKYRGKNAKKSLAEKKPTEGQVATEGSA
ncbi:hypothetical protein FOL46_001036 [Perkinsus olseni]|uniref:Ribosomal RNA-processing protein 14/surfeit locus protein 6 C-terminal domain-containing protein n=1 Tax=Perkinsus olseni TaxID=32597 RepID=A0A7J6MF53_PEROL|nr:hypothetical protein FOL46_001036 [Perkinsus olseni]